MKAVFKSLRKPATFMLALVLVLSFSMTAFADTGATVSFYDDTTSTQLGTTQQVALDDIISKDYLPSGYTDPLNGAPSVYDAIIKAADQLGYDTDVGWDANPAYGDPGGYISNIAVGNTSYPTINNYTYDPETGLHIADGYGWICKITPDGGTQYEPDQYLTLEALEDGMDIEFRYQHYHYEWYD
jgi:hypothetical protein